MLIPVLVIIQIKGRQIRRDSLCGSDLIAPDVTLDLRVGGWVGEGGDILGYF